jgi:magnesium transporter
VDVGVATGVEVGFVSDDGVEQHPVDGLGSLLERDDGLVWVDIPNCDEAAARMLAEVFEFHLLAVHRLRRAQRRSQGPRPP